MSMPNDNSEERIVIRPEELEAPPPQLQHTEPVISVYSTPEGHNIVGQPKISESVRKLLEEGQPAGATFRWDFKHGPRTLQFYEGGDQPHAKTRIADVVTMRLQAIVEAQALSTIRLVGAATKEGPVSLPPLPHELKSTLQSVTDEQKFQTAAKIAGATLEHMRKRMQQQTEKEHQPARPPIPQEVEEALVMLMDIRAKRERALGQPKGFGHLLHRMMTNVRPGEEKPRRASEMLKTALAGAHGNIPLSRAVLQYLGELAEAQNGELGPAPQVAKCRATAKQLLIETGYAEDEEKAVEGGGRRRRRGVEDGLQQLSADPAPQNRTSRQAGFDIICTEISREAMRPPQHEASQEGRTKAEKFDGMLQSAIDAAQKSEFFMALPAQQRKQLEQTFGEARGRIDKRRNERGRK